MSTHFKSTKIFASFQNQRVKQLFEQVWEHLPAEDERRLEEALVNITDFQFLGSGGMAVFDPAFRTIP